jgi:hypothetical protein
MVTARTVIRRSLLLLGVIASSEPLVADEAADGLSSLNALVESWSLERWMIYHIPRLDVPLVPGQASYTWGLPGGQIASVRPLKLDGALVRLASTPELDWPVAVLTPMEYQRGVGLKDLESTYPLAVSYAPSWPLGVLSVWPVPQSADTLGLFPWVPLTGFASLDTVVNLPPGYERLLVAGLATEQAPMYGKEVPVTIAAMLSEARSNVKRLNAVTPVLGCDPALQTPAYGTSDLAGFTSGGMDTGWGR